MEKIFPYLQQLKPCGFCGIFLIYDASNIKQYNSALNQLENFQWPANIISDCIKKSPNACGFLFSTNLQLFLSKNNWAAPSEFGTYRLCEQRRFRRACASAQSRQNLRCSLIQAVSQEEPSDRKPDPWLL